MDLGQYENLLRARLERGELVLVLGAGANAGSQNRYDKPIKFGRDLSELLCEEMGEIHKGEPLAEVVSAYEHLMGREALNKILIREFRFAKPSSTMKSIFQYTWKRIYTWNYDDAIIDASNNSVQRVSPYNGLADAVEDIPEISNIQIVYLHGMITQIDKGLILSEQDYADHLQKGAHLWYRRAVQDYRMNTVIFVGSSMNEPILAAELERAARNGIGGSGLAFLVVPDEISAVSAAAFAKRGIIHIRATLDEFVNWVERSLGAKNPPAAIVTTGKFFDEKNIGKFTFDDVSAAQVLKPIDANVLLNSFENESPARKASAARAFLNGFPPTWGLASSDVPVRLAQLSDLNKEILRASQSGVELFVTVGQAGSGKSTATMQALLDISKTKDLDIFELSTEAPSVSRALSVLSRISEKRKLLYLPNLFVFGSQLADDFAAARDANVMFVTTARSSEWKEHFERHFATRSVSFAFQRFSSEDHAPLIERLKTYVPSPSFVKLKRDQQFDKLARSKNQLLIALREATESRNFDEVIIDEFRSLADDDVRELFIIVGIATLARVGIYPAVAAEAYGLSPRGRSFQDALSSLEGIVAPLASGRLIARHEFYVRNILDQVVPIDITLRAICSTLSTFTKYSIPITKHVSRPDAALFRFLLNHGFLRERSERGGDKYAGIDVYRQFEISFQLDGHFWLQYGLYYQRLGNSPLAIEMLEKSVAAFPGNPFAIHALASERLMQARNRAHYDNETQRLIRLAIGELERIQNNPLHHLDHYPLVTLSRYHVATLIAHKQTNVAQEYAKEYYERLRVLEKIAPSAEIVDAKARLLKFVTSGIWEV